MKKITQKSINPDELIKKIRQRFSYIFPNKVIEEIFALNKKTQATYQEIQLDAAREKCAAKGISLK